MSLRTCPQHGVYVADDSTDFGETWCPECGPSPVVSKSGALVAGDAIGVPSPASSALPHAPEAGGPPPMPSPGPPAPNHAS